MHIEKKHFLDASEQDADGFYEYYYEGDVYRIFSERFMYLAKTYIHTPKTLSFMARSPIKVESFLSKLLFPNRFRFKKIPYRDDDFRECVLYSKNELGFERFDVLTRLYETVDLDRLFVKSPK